MFVQLQLFFGGLLVRRFVFFTMTILFLLTIISGFGGAHDNPGNPGINADQGQSGMHVAISILFVVSTIIHIMINRKPLGQYFKGPVNRQIK
jgi:hypothetical protein